ncbi:unnamed protein product [Phytophthora fragariaefolia]|uniref:Unnamed protein product n=1 Tax=Phytophthora fragariaefolia TaxID=1490495 RepID=A0A9W6YCJ6_9STRA|nr:unnamed protein product [Phytophthora fragariaefolia]
MSSAPAAVRQVIENWTEVGPFRRKPAQPGETSFIFDWGGCLLDALVKKDEMKVIITAERIGETIIELYSSTRKDITEFFEANKEVYPNFTMMADFWTCKTTSKKYLGLRVYVVDRNWQFMSVRASSVPHTPIVIKGSDVRCLPTDELQLRWEWCIAHMAHAATRSACGMNDKKQDHPEIGELITQLTTTSYQMRTVEVTGDLFEALCNSRTETSTTRLLNYSSARFLSITNAIRRVLDMWPALEE